MFKKILAFYSILACFGLLFYLNYSNVSYNNDTNVSVSNQFREKKNAKRNLFITQYDNFPNVEFSDNSIEYIDSTSFTIDTLNSKNLFYINFFPSLEYENSTYYVGWNLGLALQTNLQDYPFNFTYILLSHSDNFNFNNFYIDDLSLSFYATDFVSSVELELEISLSNDSNQFFVCYIYFDFDNLLDLSNIFGIQFDINTSYVYNFFNGDINLYDEYIVFDFYYPLGAIESVNYLFSFVNNSLNYDTGYDNGYENGLNEGYDEGYTQGLADGKEQGYDEGFLAGINSNNYVNNFVPNNIWIFSETYFDPQGSYTESYDFGDFVFLNNDWYENGFRFRDTLSYIYDDFYANDLEPIAPDDFNTVVLSFHFDNPILGEKLKLTTLNFEEITFDTIDNNYFSYVVPRENLGSFNDININLNNLIIDTIAFKVNLNFHLDRQTFINTYSGQLAIINNYISDYQNGYNDGLNSQVITIKNKDKEIQYLQERLNSLLEDEFTLSNLFWSIGTIPFETIKTVWNFEFLGFNLAQFVTGLITAFIIIWILKKVLK